MANSLSLDQILLLYCQKTQNFAYYAIGKFHVSENILIKF